MSARLRPHVMDHTLPSLALALPPALIDILSWPISLHKRSWSSLLLVFRLCHALLKSTSARVWSSSSLFLGMCTCPHSLSSSYASARTRPSPTHVHPTPARAHARPTRVHLLPTPSARHTPPPFHTHTTTIARPTSACRRQALSPHFPFSPSLHLARLPSTART